jgi:hypothetical protein
MAEERGKVTELDKWVLAILGLIALSLIVASVITRDQIYLAALGTDAFLAFMYFVFFR